LWSETLSYFTVLLLFSDITSDLSFSFVSKNPFLDPTHKCVFIHIKCFIWFSLKQDLTLCSLFIHFIWNFHLQICTFLHHTHFISHTSPFFISNFKFCLFNIFSHVFFLPLHLGVDQRKRRFSSFWWWASPYFFLNHP
jgi:hypothetical protein